MVSLYTFLSIIGYKLLFRFDLVPRKLQTYRLFVDNENIYCGKHLGIYFRDGQFDIQGGWDFSLRQVIFFSLFAQQVTFFESKLQQVFYFFKK